MDDYQRAMSLPRTSVEAAAALAGFGHDLTNAVLLHGKLQDGFSHESRCDSSDWTGWKHATVAFGEYVFEDMLSDEFEEELKQHLGVLLPIKLVSSYRRVVQDARFIEELVIFGRCGYGKLPRWSESEVNRDESQNFAAHPREAQGLCDDISKMIDCLVMFSTTTATSSLIQQLISFANRVHVNVELAKDKRSLPDRLFTSFNPRLINECQRERHLAAAALVSCDFEPLKQYLATCIDRNPTNKPRSLAASNPTKIEISLRPEVLNTKLQDKLRASAVLTLKEHFMLSNPLIAKLINKRIDGGEIHLGPKFCGETDENLGNSVSQIVSAIRKANA